MDGVINCTPVGHESFLGNPLPQIKTMENQWVYDVIYTPAKTEFLKRAEINKSKFIHHGIVMNIKENIILQKILKYHFLKLIKQKITLKIIQKII